jgi:hypothetical protein
LAKCFFCMLIFENLFLEFESAAYCKKRDSYNEHPIKQLALLILSGL